MKAPGFWWQPGSLEGFLLSPLSIFYGAVAARAFGKGVETGLPVLCIGNFIVGGAGKTPVAIALYRLFEKKGKKPAFLTRGYGGRLHGPHLVDKIADTACDIGDEACLLAKVGQTCVAGNRVKGAALLAQECDADLIIMDDGFQSATIKPRHALIVVDAQRGLGNGFILPAGPLRANLKEQVKYASSLLIIRNGGPDHNSIVPLIALFKATKKPVFFAKIAPVNADYFKGRPVIAYSGIGNPRKFFQSLENAGVDLRQKYSFADHHVFNEKEATTLLQKAQAGNLQLVTTSKDHVRLRGAKSGEAGPLKELADKTEIFDIEIVFENEKALIEQIQTGF